MKFNLKSIFKQYEKREVRNAYLFLLPILFVIFAFIFIPVIGTLVNSFYRDITYEEGTPFVGFENYVKILTNPDFWSSFGFTMLFTITAVLFETALGLIFALILNEAFFGRGALRTVILIPWAIPTIVSAKIWKLTYNYQGGILNYLAVAMGLSPDKIDWIGTGVNAFWSLMLADVWKTTPFVVIILLAGLQAIPTDIYKQAKIDGAGMLKSFFSITLPLIKPVLTITLIFRTVDTLRIFDIVYALTGGGPAGSTETLSSFGYKYFANAEFGMGSTISIITFIIAFIIAIVYVKAGKFGESFK